MSEYKIDPVSKPRMTQRDKWKKRPCVVRYREFKDKIREANVKIEPYGDHIIFYIQMPKSWSKKKKKEMDNTLHQQRPDVDNLAKALLDAVFDEDSYIADYRNTKVWSYEGKIKISRINEDIVL